MRFLELMERVKGRGVAVGEVRLGEWGIDSEVMGVAEDSRKVKAGDVFVAKARSRADIEKYVDEAFGKGAVATVLPADYAPSGPRAYERNPAVRVDDVNLACAMLAHEVAGNPTSGMKMIGVTGTKGKTTVAYLLRSVLKAAGHKVGMIGTVEIDDGEKAVPAEMTTPGSVELVEMFSRMRANGVTHCVMEVSSHALHQRRVAEIDWAVAIFTNLTGDHLDYHGTMEEYAKAKAMLFRGLKRGAAGVINLDDPWGAFMLERTKDIGWTYGLNNRDAQWTARIESMKSESMRLNVRGSVLETSLIGKHNAYNILAVVVAADELGISLPNVLRTLSSELGAPGRLQRVPAEGIVVPFQVFVDYAHTHDALENVLTALRATMGGGSSGPAAGEMLLTQTRDREVVGPGRDSIANDDPSLRQKHGTPPSGRLICVFGCGGDRDRTKRPKMGAVAERLADVVVVTSDNPRTEEPGAIIEEICAGFSAGWKTSGKITIEPDRRAAIKLAIGMARAGDVVLLAGKGHENYQIVGTTKHHFDDVEEAEAALRDRMTGEEKKLGI